MPTVNIIISDIQNHAINGDSMPVMKSLPKSVETFTDVATLKTSSNRISVVTGEFWTITVTGVDVFVKFGNDPGNTFENDWLILDGQTREFSGKYDDLLAVIDATSVLSFIILYGLDFSTEENSMTFVTPGFL